jgi:hypothetical protein
MTKADISDRLESIIRRELELSADYNALAEAIVAEDIDYPPLVNQTLTHVGGLGVKVIGDRIRATVRYHVGSVRKAVR